MKDELEQLKQLVVQNSGKQKLKTKKRLGKIENEVRKKTNLIMDTLHSFENLGNEASIKEFPSALRQYIVWHNRNRLDATSKKKYLIYTCLKDKLCGGLGDRLNGILTALAFAMQTNRVFLIHHQRPRPLEDVLQPNLIDWSFRAERIRKGNILHINLVDARPISYRQRKDLWIPSKESKYDTIILKSNIKLLKSPFSSNSTGSEPNISIDLTYEKKTPISKSISCLLKSLFKKADAFQVYLAQYKNKLKLYPGTPYVGMHIRIGKSNKFSDTVTLNSLSETPRFIQCAKKIMKLYNFGITRIFLASDNEKVKKLLAKEFKENLITSGNNAFHIDRYSPTEKFSVLKRGFWRTWAEFFTLESSHCLVGSPSGFTNQAVQFSVNYKTGARCWALYDQC
eukprot:Pgem_evm1s821